MNGPLLTLMLAAMLAWQVDGPPEAAEVASDEAIARAVQRLGDAEFTTRRAASQFLWRQGRRAEEALRQAARSPDVEVRLRASEILRDFEYGILPGVRREVVEQITEFRSGDLDARQRAVQTLIEGDQLETAIHLIGLDRGTASRRRLLAALMQIPAAMEQYATLEKIEALVQRVAADQDEAWRRITVGRLFFSASMIERLAAQGQLEELTAFLQREPDPRVRSQILSSVFANPTTLAAVIKHGDLTLLFALADAAPNETQRTQLLTQLLTSEHSIAQVLEQGKLDDLLARMEKSFDERGRQFLMNQLLRSPALSQLFEQRSVDELIEWLRQEKNPQLRGQLLAALMSSSAVQKKLRDEGRLDLIVSVMADESEPDARRAYLESVVRSLSGMMLQDRTIPDGLWQLIKADEDIPWRAGVAEALLRSGTLTTSFANEEEVNWLLETIRAGGTNGKALSGTLFSQHRTLSILLENGYFDALWELARESADHQRGQRLAQLVRHRSAAEVFNDANRVGELLSHARDETAPAARQDYLRGLVTSPAAVMALLREGKYDAVSEIVLATEDAVQRAELFGHLAQNPAATEHLRKQGQLSTLLDFADAQPTPAARAAFLQPLFNSNALTLLLQAGHYDRLLAYVDEQPADDHTLSISFYANLAVVERLVETDRVAELIARAKATGEAERSSFLQRLVNNRQLVALLVDSGHIETLLALLDAEPLPARRGSHLGSLLASSEVATSLVAQEKLPLVLKRIESENEAEARHAMLRQVLGNTRTLTIWIDAGMLDPLVALAEDEEDPQRKAEFLVSLAANDAALNRWKQEKRLASVLAMADSFGRGDAARNARWTFVSRLFSNSRVVQQLVDEGLFDQLLRIAAREPEARHRIHLLQSLVQNRATSTYLAAQNRLPELLEIAQDDPDAQVRQAYLGSLVANPGAIALLVDAGLYEETAELVLASRDAEQRAGLYGRLVQQPRVAEHLKENDQIESLLKFAEEQATPEIRNAFLRPVFSSNVLAALIDRGHFGRLRSYLEDEVPSRDGLVASFYANPAVVDRLIEEQQVDLLLARAHSLDADARYEFLRRLAYRHDVLSELVRSGHYDALVALVRALPDASQRSSLLGTMWRSPQLAQQLAAQKKLGSVLEILRSEQDAEARLRMLQMVVDNISTIAVWSQSDLLDRLIELIQEQRDADRKRDLLVRLATNDALLQQWTAKGQLAKVLLLADSFGPTPAMATARRQYLMRVFGDQNASNRLVRYGLYDQMLKLATSEPTEESRFVLLRSLAANFATTEYLASQDRLPELLEIARSATTDAARRNYLDGLVNNFPAISALVDSGHYDGLADLVLTTEDAVGRASLFGNLVRHGRVMRHLAEQNQIETLWQFAEQQKTPEARDAFLQPLLRSGDLRLLIERGDYDRLRRFLDEQTPARDALVASFYANPAVLNRMVAEKQIEPVLARAQELDADGRYELLRRLVYQSAFMGELVKAGHFDSLIALARSERDSSRRGTLLGTIVRTPDIAEQLAARDELADLLAIPRAEQDPQVQQMIVSQLVSDSRSLQFWTGEKMLDRLIDLIQSHAEPGQRTRLLAQLVVQPPVLEQWAGLQTEKILALGDSLDEKHGEAARRDYLRHVFGNAHALRTLVENGALERLLEIARDESDSTERAGMLQPLLQNQGTAAWLAKQQTAERLVEVVRDEPDDAVRSACLAGIAQNSAAVAALAEAGQIEAFVSLCRQISDEGDRRKLKAQLLLSPRVVEYLADQKLLADHLQAMLSEPDASGRHQAFHQLVTQPGSLQAIDRAGMFGSLIEGLEAELAAPRFDGSSEHASFSGELLELLVEHDRVPLVLALLKHSPHPAIRRRDLAVLLTRPKVLRAVLEHESLDRLLEHAASSPSPYGGGNLWIDTAQSPEVVRILVEHDQIGWLFEEAEQNPQSRFQVVSTLLRPEMQEVLEHSAVADRLLALARLSLAQPNGPPEVDRLLSHAGLRQTLIARGDVDKLLELLPLAAARDRLRDEILFSPTGLVVHHIARGEISAAEQVIQMHAAVGDEGRLLLASLLVSSGTLQPRIDQLQQRIAEAAEPEPDDLRTLVYLHRAAGDLESAAAVAERTRDAHLVHAIAHERRDWEAAARQLDGAAEGFTPPIPLRRSPPSPLQQRTERLGKLAAYWRLAGDDAKANATLDQIERLVADGGPAIEWDCAEALLLNDRVEAGMALLEKSAPLRAFDLLCARLDYPAALRLVGSDEGTTFDADWYASLPPRAANGDGVRQREQRLKLAVRLARLLRLWGRDEPSEQIIDFLKRHAQQQPDVEDGQESRRLHWEWLASELYKSEMYSRAWQAAQQATKPGQEARLVSEFFSTRGSEAMAWWSYFRRVHSDEPAHETLRRIHYLLHPAQSDAADVLAGTGDFAQMVEAASDVSAMPPDQVSSFLAGLAHTCIEHGQSDLALRLLERVPEPQLFATRSLALELGRHGRHREAADQWMKAWQAHRGQPQYLYLSGHALIRAGEVEGEKRKSQASMSALRSDVRHRMAIALHREGLASDAAEQWKLVARTAPMDHWEWNDAVRLLGDHAHRQNDHESAADLWEQYMLMNLRSDSSFNQTEFYLRLPVLVRTQRAAAAAAAGECESAVVQAELALAAMPGQTSVIDDLVPQLQEQGCGTAADALFARMHAYYHRRLAEFPDSGQLHNNLAWLEARCHRHLDEALTHARRAVERSPDNPGYVDTLAEVHFRRGDRAEAVRLSERSVALAPDNDLHRKQLERFRDEPLPE